MHLPHELAMVFIRGLAYIMRLDTFELALKMEFWVSEHDDGPVELRRKVHAFLPAMIEALRSVGTKMRVWCQEGRIEEKMLYVAFTENRPLILPVFGR
jgi:hypothetical protein